MSHYTSHVPPQTGQASGGSLEQAELFELPKFSPTLPPANSHAQKALSDLLRQDLTQLEWLTWGRGWRLSAAIKELNYLGWKVISFKVKHHGWLKPIARYSLSAQAKAYATRALRSRP